MRAWRIGTAFGIGIFVHWSFSLLVAFVLFQNWDDSGWGKAIYAGFMLISVFACVVFHELGHALMARKYGIPTRDITLYPIGGVARLERMTEKPSEELAIALAGPAVNVAIAMFLAIPLLLSVGFQGVTADSFAIFRPGRYLLDLLIINIWLVVLNLVPAFPMDGGRVLRAALVPLFGRLGATQIAAGVGAAFAFGFAALAIAWTFLVGYPQPMLLLIAGFVYVTGQQELAMVRYKELARRAEPLTVLPAEPNVLEVQAVPVEPGHTVAAWDNASGAWVVWQNGRPIQTFWVD